MSCSLIHSTDVLEPVSRLIQIIQATLTTPRLVQAFVLGRLAVPVVDALISLSALSVFIIGTSVDIIVMHGSHRYHRHVGTLVSILTSIDTAVMNCFHRYHRSLQHVGTFVSTIRRTVRALLLIVSIVMITRSDPWIRLSSRLLSMNRRRRQCFYHHHCRERAMTVRNVP